MRISEKYGNKTNIIKLISRGIDLNFFNPNKIDQNKDNEIYNEFKFNRHAIKILLPGRLTGWKGHMLLLKALNIIFEKYNTRYRNYFCRARQ